MKQEILNRKVIETLSQMVSFLKGTTQKKTLPL